MELFKGKLLQINDQDDPNNGEIGSVIFLNEKVVTLRFLDQSKGFYLMNKLADVSPRQQVLYLLSQIEKAILADATVVLIDKEGEERSFDWLEPVCSSTLKNHACISLASTIANLVKKQDEGYTFTFANSEDV